MTQPLTIEEYHGYNAVQRKKIKRDVLQTLQDEHLNGEENVNSIRGVIREELDTKFEVLKTELSTAFNLKYDNLKKDNEKLTREITQKRESKHIYPHNLA